MNASLPTVPDARLAPTPARTLTRFALFLALWVATSLFDTPSAAAQEGASAETAPSHQVELTGILKRPIKWTPQLEIIPAGQIQRIDLEGPQLRDLRDGTLLRVRGTVKSRLHPGSTTENLSPFPKQWIIWLEIAELEVLKEIP